MLRRPETDGLPFVGRETELGVLVSAAHLASTSRGRPVLVYGEAGAGKSHLVRQLASRLRAQGWRVLNATLDAEDEHSVSLREQLVRTLGYSHASAPLHDADASIQREFGTPRDSVLSLGAASRADAEYLISRLIESAQEAPILVVIDEIRSVSSHDRWLMSFLAEQSTAARILPVFIARDEDFEPGTDLHRLMSLVTQRGSLLRLRLGALPLADVSAYLRLRLDARRDDETAVQVHARTDGNAFFVQELTSWLASDPTERPLEEVLNGPPDPIRDVIEFRLRMLPEAIQHLLLVAAVVGRRFDARIVAAAAEVPLEMAVDQLDAGVHHRVLMSGERTWTYTFSHALTRDTLLARLLPSRRALIHGQIADAMAQTFGPHASVYLPARAGHLAAAAGGDPERVAEALDALRAAAAVHEAAADWDAALSCCRQYLEVAEQAGATLTPSSTALVCLAGGRNALLAGQIRVAWQILRRGVAFARYAEDHALACDILLVALESIDLPYSRSSALAREALTSSEPISPATRVRLLLQVAGQDLSDESVAVIDEARRLADAHDLRDLAGLIEGRRYAELIGTGDLDGAENLARGEQRRHAASGGRPQEARAFARLAEILVRTGRLTEAQSVAERALETALSGHATAPATRARCVMLSIAIARSDTVAADALARDIGDHPLVYQFRARGFEIAGELERAIAVMESEAPAMRRHPRIAWDYHGTMARLFTRAGRDVDARAHLYSWIHRRTETHHPGDRLDSLGVVAEGLVHASDALVAEILEEFESRGQARFSLTNAAGLDYGRALLALRLGRIEAGRRYAVQAVSWARAEGLPAEEMRALVLLATCEGQRDATNPEERVDRHALEQSNLSEREIEVLCLVAEGQTNRQIAQRLMISHHTVARHVSHILTKTGASNRTEAARTAYRTGFLNADSKI